MPQTISLNDDNLIWLQPVADSLGTTVERVVNHVLFKHRPFDESQFKIPSDPNEPVDPDEWNRMWARLEESMNHGPCWNDLRRTTNASTEAEPH